MTFIAILAAAIYGSGAATPADHVAEVERVIERPISEVAADIRDVRRYSSWRPALVVENVEERADGVDYVEVSEGDRISYTLSEPVPGEQFVTTLTDPTLPFGGHWTITLAPDGAGTHVRIEERGRIRDPLYRFFARFVFGYTTSMENYLNALAADAQ